MHEVTWIFFAHLKRMIQGVHVWVHLCTFCISKFCKSKISKKYYKIKKKFCVQSFVFINVTFVQKTVIVIIFNHKKTFRKEKLSIICSTSPIFQFSWTDFLNVNIRFYTFLLNNSEYVRKWWIPYLVFFISVQKPTKHHTKFNLHQHSIRMYWVEGLLFIENFKQYASR